MVRFLALNLSLQNWLLDLFFPRRCVTCKTEGAWLCQECSTHIRAEISRFAISQTEVKGLFSFNQPAIRELLHNLKYNGISEIAAVLTELAAQLGLLQQLPMRCDQVLVPIPTTKAKLKDRGYNQAEELAKKLGLYFNLPVDTTILLRRGGKGSQVGKDALERGMVENRFHLGSGDYRHLHILLVDDVCTTGSTLRRAEAVLKQSGCASIEGIVMARK